MKRVIRTVFAMAAAGLVFFASCKKDYHCECSYNNTVMLNKDLGAQVHSDATTQCNAYDTSVTGETWKCIVY